MCSFSIWDKLKSSLHIPTTGDALLHFQGLAYINYNNSGFEEYQVAELHEKTLIGKATKIFSTIAFKACSRTNYGHVILGQVLQLPLP